MIGKLTVAIATLVAVGDAGCATIFSGSDQQVTITSRPPGARVTLNGDYSGVTPLSLTVKTQLNYTLVLQRAGYRDATATIHRDLNPVAIIDVLFLPFLAIDLATGAFWRLEPTGVNVTLQPGPMMPYGEGWPAPPQQPTDPWSSPSAPPPQYPPSSPSSPPGAPPLAYPPPAVPSNPP